MAPDLSVPPRIISRVFSRSRPLRLAKACGIGHADHAGAQRHLVGELGSLALAGAIEAADVGRKGGKDVADWR